MRKKHLSEDDTISAQHGVQTAAGGPDESQIINDYADFTILHTTEALMDGDRHGQRLVAYSGFDGSSKKREDESLSMQTPREMRPTLDSGKGSPDHSLEKRAEMHRREIREDESERLSHIHLQQPSSYINKSNLELQK